MSSKRQRQDKDKDKMAEERCFRCKDSGHDLRVCNSRNCLKAYHPRCVGNKDEEGFICDWHICVQCRGRSDYQCLCCPRYSVCCACLGKVEFVQLRKENKGFCSTCLNLAIAIEKNDPHVAKTDNYEILFKDYWEGIKDAEHLTLVDLEEASDILNRKLNCKEAANLERFLADDHKSDENTSPDNGANDQTIPFDSKGKQIKANKSQKNKSKRRTYVGWGSKELIEFLSSFGKDTAKSLDEFEITEVVKEYIKQQKLYQGGNKLCFLCDDKLRPLFMTQKVRCKMIRRSLAIHLASNAVSEDEIFFSYEDEGDAPVTKNRPRNSPEPKIAKSVSEIGNRRFASINQHNINLIYLRKTLVVSLLSQPDRYEQKVIGCFVRVKCGKKVKNSYGVPKKAYLLGQVTGIKKCKNEYKINDTFTDTLLCVTGLLDDVCISMLSDEDLAEDDCDDLISLAEKGLLKRATVAELEEKVATVHTDIVNHWIERELVRLERKIDIAQMKGLHIEMAELLDQKKLLNTPAERQRRLEEVPEVVPDTEYQEKETELQVAARNSSQENRGAAHQVVENVLHGEPSKGVIEIVDSLNVLNGEPSKEENRGGEGNQAAKAGDNVEESAISERPKRMIQPNKKYINPDWVYDLLVPGATEQIHDCLDILNKGSSEVVSKQGDPTCEEADPGVDWSVVNSDGSEEKRDAEEETLSVRTSPKRGAQSSSETSEPKKPRLSEERADHPRPLRLVYRQEPPAGLSFAEPPPNERPQERTLWQYRRRSTVSPVAAIGPSPPPLQGPVRQEGEERAGEMPPPRDAEAAETGGSAPSPGAEDTYPGVPPPEPERETGEATVKGAAVVAPPASCLDSMDVEAPPSPRPWPAAEADALEPQEQVPATGANVGDGPSPEPWAAEPSWADETIVPTPEELISEETIVAATELVAGPSSGPACLVANQNQSGPLSACPSSRALVRVPDPTDPELVGLDLGDEAELAAWLRVANGGKRAKRQVLAALQLLTRATSHLDVDDDVLALDPRLHESWTAKSRVLREQHAALQSERRRREALSAELASAERALGEARSEAEGHEAEAEARRAEQRALELAQGWSKELADVRRQLEDAQAQLERERDSAAQAAEAARQAAVEESAGLVAQLEELRRGKAASDAAAQESARRVEVLKREKLGVEAAHQSSERARQVAEAGLIGCKELISRLERQFSSSMEERSELLTTIDQVQQLAAEAGDLVRKDGSRVLTRQLHQLHQAAAAACDRTGKDGVRTRAMRRR